MPIVPAAVIFDLSAGGDFTQAPRRRVRPAGLRRRRDAVAVRQGTVGAGTGAHAAALKGGIGSASVVTDDGITVAALVVLNSGGSPVNPATGELWGAPARAARRVRRAAPAARRRGRRVPGDPLAAVGADQHDARRRRHRRPADQGRVRARRRRRPRRHGPRHQPDPHLHRRRRRVHAGDRRRRGARDAPPGGFIRPAVARFAQLAPIITAAADTVARAIVHATLAATSAGTMTSYRDQLPSAIRAVLSCYTRGGRRSIGGPPWTR